MTIVGLIGTWLMTEPDPSGIGEDGNVNARKIVRVTLIVNVAASLLVQLLSLLPDQRGVQTLFLVISVVSALIALVGEWYKYIFYERLANRIPDSKIASRARFLRVGYAILYGTAGVGGAVVALVMGGPPTTAGAAFAPLMMLVGIAGLVLIILSILTIGLILKLRKLLLEQAELARLTWAAQLPIARAAT